MAESATNESANADSDSVRPQTSTAPPSAVADMLAKVAAYVEGEAELSIEDYRLLETMNLTAAERYSGMAEYSAGLIAFAERLQSKCEEVMPQLAQVQCNPPRPCGSSPGSLDLVHCACPAGVYRLTRSRPRCASSRELWKNSTDIHGGSSASSWTYERAHDRSNDGTKRLNSRPLWLPRKAAMPSIVRAMAAVYQP